MLIDNVRRHGLHFGAIYSYVPRLAVVDAFASAFFVFLLAEVHLLDVLELRLIQRLTKRGDVTVRPLITLDLRLVQVAIIAHRMLQIGHLPLGRPRTLLDDAFLTLLLRHLLLAHDPEVHLFLHEDAILDLASLIVLLPRRARPFMACFLAGYVASRRSWMAQLRLLCHEHQLLVLHVQMIKMVEIEIGI